MTPYISLLRGINVSGQKKILMKDLKTLYEDLGYEEVLTYIQSGNVIFKTHPTIASQLEAKIAKAIHNAYGFNVPVLVKSKAALQELMDAMPFALSPEALDKKLYYTLLASSPEPVLLVPILAQQNKAEQIQFAHDTLYFYCPNGYGRTKLNNNFFESKLKVKATTRNHRTMIKLLELSASV